MKARNGEWPGKETAEHLIGTRLSYREAAGLFDMHYADAEVNSMEKHCDWTAHEHGEHARIIRAHNPLYKGGYDGCGTAILPAH